MVLTSLMEIFSIGAVIPLIAALTNPSKVFNNAHLENLFIYLQFKEPEQIVLPITIGFISLSVAAAVMRLALLWLNNKFIFGVGKDLGCDLFKKILQQEYEVHVQRNSSIIISTLTSKIESVLYSSIMTSMNFISATIMLLFILTGLLVVDYRVTVGFIIFFGVSYLIIIKLSKNYLYKNGAIAVSSSIHLLKIVQESLGGIRDIIIDQSQESFYRDYKINDSKLRLVQLRNIFISTAPRYFIECMGTVGIALTAYILTNSEGAYTSIAMLAILAIGAQKLLPLVQQAYASLTEFKINQQSLKDVLDLLSQTDGGVKDQEAHSIKKIPFNNFVLLKNISFSYPGNPKPILDNLSLTINKGDRIGIIGETGSGKSTFLDIFMGLLNVDFGEFIIDDVALGQLNKASWRMHIAHVPQSIYLSDNSIAANIAFGKDLSDIDMELVEKVSSEAKLSGVIKNLPHGYQTQIGERGVLLSGGQRQRIGIARALYKRADVIVLDEATSALDEDTESALMDNIYDLHPELTLVIVAHRLSTLKGCNRIIRIDGGVVREVDPKSIAT